MNGKTLLFILENTISSQAKLHQFSDKNGKNKKRSTGMVLLLGFNIKTPLIWI